MKRYLCWLFIIISALSLGAVPSAPYLHLEGVPMANTFDGDSACAALFNHESGALNTDSIGTNTLTNNGVTANTTDYKQGAAAGNYVAASDYYQYISDASLDSGFPLKSGDTNKIISFCLWFKFNSLGNLHYLVSKYHTTSNRTLALQINATTNVMAFLIGYNSGDSTEGATGTHTFVTGRWYHVGVTFDDSDGSYKVRVWDDTASSIVENMSGNFTNNIFVGTAALYLGNRDGGSTSRNFDGIMDEVVFFNDVLSTTQIDLIRQGAYYTMAAGAGSYTLTGQSAGLLKDSVIGAGSGSYALNGQDASLEKSYVIAADGGSYSLVGSDANLLFGYVMDAEAGSYSLSGQVAGLIADSVVAADPGSYEVSGQAAALALERKIAAASGSYVLTGSDAALTYTPLILATGAPSADELTLLLRR